MRNESRFVMAINRTLRKKNEIIQICEATMEKRCDIQSLKEEQQKLQAELEVARGLMERLITLNATTVMDQDEYNRQFAEYEARYNEIQQRIDNAESEQKQRIAKRCKLTEYLETLKAQGLISRFNETLWYGTVEQVRVRKDGTLRFVFKDGSTVDC